MTESSAVRSALFSSLFFGARVGGAAAGVAAQLLLLRALGPVTVGTFFLAASVSSILGVTAAFGYPSIAARFIARYARSGRYRVEQAFVQTAQRDALALASVLALALASLTLVPGLLARETSSAMFAAAFAIPAIALLRVNGAVSMARFCFATAYLPELVVRSGCFLGFVVVGVLYFNVTDAYQISTLFAAAALIACILQVSLVRGGWHPKPRVRRTLRQLWRRASVPFVPITLVAVLFADLAVVIAGPFLPRGELAVFAVLLRIAFFVGFVVDVLHDMASVRLARMHTTGNHGLIGAEIHGTNTVTLAAVLVGGAITAVAAKHILDLFDLYSPGIATVLVVLLATQLIRAIAGPAVGLLTIIGCPRDISGGYAVGLAVLLAATFLLAPRFGLPGAAVAVVLAVAAMNVSFCASLALRTGLRSDLFFTMYQAARCLLAKSPSPPPRPPASRPHFLW
jgi:O-antigen/teichoic acid export membrane protein